MWVKKTATLIISEGRTILGGPTELHLIDQRCQAGLKSTLCSEAIAQRHFANVYHVTLDPRPSLVSFSLQVKKAERGLGTRVQ